MQVVQNIIGADLIQKSIMMDIIMVNHLKEQIGIIVLEHMDIKEIVHQP